MTGREEIDEIGAEHPDDAGPTYVPPAPPSPERIAADQAEELERAKALLHGVTDRPKALTLLADHGIGGRLVSDWLHKKFREEDHGWA